MEVYLRNIVRFFIGLLVQLLVINMVDFGSYSSFIYPLFYVMFVILLPLSIPHVLLIILAFTNGIVLDAFMSTGGLHASSLVLLAFVRPYLLKFIAPREDYDVSRPISVKYLGFRRFVAYVSLAILVQHFWFFSVEFFRFSELHIIIGKTISNGFFTLVLILAYDTFTNR